MLPTLLIGAAVLCLFLLAIRRTRKKGTCDCSGCDGACGGQCPSAQTKKQ